MGTAGGQQLGEHNKCTRALVLQTSVAIVVTVLLLCTAGKAIVITVETLQIIGIFCIFLPIFIYNALSKKRF